MVQVAQRLSDVAATIAEADHIVGLLSDEVMSEVTL
jgi:hypothetical protein